MSVQTEINRISTAVSDQADLIAQIQTALEGKAAGGGGVSLPTCGIKLVNVNTSSIYSAEATCTVLEDGALVTKYVTAAVGVQENVLCSTNVIVSAEDAIISDLTTTNGYCDYIIESLAVVTLDGVPSGEVVTITVTCD